MSSSRRRGGALLDVGSSYRFHSRSVVEVGGQCIAVGRNAELLLECSLAALLVGAGHVVVIVNLDRHMIRVRPIDRMKRAVSSNRDRRSASGAGELTVFEQILIGVGIDLDRSQIRLP